MGTGVFRSGAGVSVGASAGVAVGTASGVAEAATAAVGGAMSFSADSESSHAAIPNAKAHIREMDTVKAKLRMSNLK